MSESQFDRQARENYEQAEARVAQVGKQLDLAKQNLARVEPLVAKLVATQQDLDQANARVLSLEEENNQAVAAANVAKEKMETGSESLKAVRQNIARLEAAEREIRLQVKAELDGHESRGARGPGHARQGPLGPRTDGGPGPERRVRAAVDPAARARSSCRCRCGR